MSINKETRQKVYEKYNGRCAYCGREIKYKDMQVDHFIAKRCGTTLTRPPQSWCYVEAGEAE